MKTTIAAAILLAITLPLRGDDPPAKDYTEFSKLVHGMVVKQVPKEYEDTSGWTGFVPLGGEILPLVNLRQRVQVGDQLMYPHGLWKRFKIRFDDPAKEITIRVTNFQAVEKGKYRLNLEAEAVLHGEGHLQHWQKGIPTLGVTALGDALVTADVTCDIDVSINTKKFPPELLAEPKITELKLGVKDFTLQRNGKLLDPGRVNDLGIDLRDFLDRTLKLVENDVKDIANLAIEQSLKDGKGAISVSEIMRVLGTTK